MRSTMQQATDLRSSCLWSALSQRYVIVVSYNIIYWGDHLRMSMSDMRLNYFCLVRLRLFVMRILCIGLTLLMYSYHCIKLLFTRFVSMGCGGAGLKPYESTTVWDDPLLLWSSWYLWMLWYSYKGEFCVVFNLSLETFWQKYFSYFLHPLFASSISGH